LELCPKTTKIIGYCYDQLKEIEDSQPTGDLWARRWASLLALLRTACLVLEAEASDYWREQVAKPNAHIKGRHAKEDWTPPIFGKFIWTNANLFLHEGVIPEGHSIMPHGSNMQRNVQGDTASKDRQIPPERYTYHMNTDPYKGQDALEIAKKAVNWLNRQVEMAGR
jgi:hypothetical protein